MSQNAGGIYYEVDARTGNLIRRTREVETSTGKMGKGFNRLEKQTDRNAKSMFNLSRVAKSLAGVFAIRQIQQFTLNTITAIDEQGKFARQIGVSYENLQRLQFAAEQSGASIGMLNNGLRRGSRNIAEAATNGGAMADAIEALGINVRQLNAMRPDQQFAAIADAIKGVKDESEQARIAYRIFGRDGEALLNTLRHGSDGLRELGNEAERTGRIIGQQTADDAARFNDELNKLQGAARGLAVQVGSQLIPKMADLISTTTDWLSTGDNARTVTDNLGTAAEITAVAIGARLVGAIATYIQSTVSASIETIRYQAALARMAGVARGAAAAKISLATATMALRSAMAFLGGPAGVIALVGYGMYRLIKTARDLNEEYHNSEARVNKLTEEYKELDKEQQKQIRRSAEEALAVVEAAKARIEAEDAVESARRSRQMQGGDVRGRTPQQDVGAAERAQSIELERLEARAQEARNQIAALDAQMDESTKSTEENTEATLGNSEAAEKATERYERLREQIFVTSNQMAMTADQQEIFAALMELGADATDEQKEKLVQALEAMQDYRREAQAMSDAVSVGESDLGLTSLDALDRQFAKEAQMLQEAQAQKDALRAEAAQRELTDLEQEYLTKLEMAGDFEQRRLALTEQYLAEREELMTQEKTGFMASLEEMGFSFDQFSNRAAGSLVSVMAGFESAGDAVRGLAKAMLTELVGAIVRMGIQAIISQKTVTAANAVMAGATASAWATPAALTSLATMGANAAPATAGMATTVAAAQGLAMGGGRLRGGNVDEGKLYPFMENGQPELVTANGNDYLFTPNRGRVTSNDDLQNEFGGGSGGSTFNFSMTVAAEVASSREQLANVLFDLEPELESMMERIANNKGQSSN